MFRARNMPRRMSLVFGSRLDLHFVEGLPQETRLTHGPRVPHRSSCFARETVRRRTIRFSSIDQAEVTVVVFQFVPVPTEEAAHGQT